MLSLCRTLVRARGVPLAARATSISSVRFNSSVSSPTKNPVSLTAQVYPIDKDSITEEDVDEWLKAIQKIKKNTDAAESSTEIYLQQLAQPEEHLSEKFVPTEEQQRQVEIVRGIPVPLYVNPLVESLVNFIMRHGKKLRAQKTVNRALYMVGLKTRRDPVVVLSETLTRLGPLFSTKTEKTGTAKNRIVPFPLNQKQRNRYAIKWIIEGSSKKKSTDMAVRLADEIISASEGKLPGYERRAQMHKTALAQRAFIKL